MVGGQVSGDPWSLPCPDSGHQSLSREGRGRHRPQGGTKEGGWPLEAWAQARPHLRSRRRALTLDESGQWAPGVQEEALVAQVGQW